MYIKQGRIYDFQGAFLQETRIVVIIKLKILLLAPLIVGEM